MSQELFQVINTNVSSLPSLSSHSSGNNRSITFYTFPLDYSSVLFPLKDSMVKLDMNEEIELLTDTRFSWGQGKKLSASALLYQIILTPGLRTMPIYTFPPQELSSFFLRKKTFLAPPLKSKIMKNKTFLYTSGLHGQAFGYSVNHQMGFQ